MELLPGTDVTIIATGLMVAKRYAPRRRSKPRSLNVRVLDMHTIKPLDRDAIQRAAARDAAPSWWPRSIWWTADSGVRVAQVVAETASVRDGVRRHREHLRGIRIRRKRCWKSTA